MEVKAVVSDPKTGRSYQIELAEDKAKTLKGKKIGDEVDGTPLGLTGYKLVVTGGSDKSGFPMRRGIHGTGRAKILLDGGVGYNPIRDERQRKRVHGEKIDDSIIQVNLKVSTAGKKKIEDILGIKDEADKIEAPAEESPKEEKAEKPKEEKVKKEKPAKEKTDNEEG
ncbi:MAG: 30S ribosomal protein S6e [Candidatus Altiarchaeota archaeon]